MKQYIKEYITSKYGVIRENMLERIIESTKLIIMYDNKTLEEAAELAVRAEINYRKEQVKSKYYKYPQYLPF